MERHEIVSRHNPVNTSPDALSPLTVGNGEFAYTADITGMQSFPETYLDGIPLCTQSQWGWHTKPTEDGGSDYSMSDLVPKPYHVGNTKTIDYYTNPYGQDKVYNWLRQNPHRMHLGQIGMCLLKDGGQPAELDDLNGINQTLDLWSGLLLSELSLQGCNVKVKTCCHSEQDIIAFRIESELIDHEKLLIKFNFPYPSPQKSSADWENDTSHNTEILHCDTGRLDLLRKIDQDEYHIGIAFTGGVQLVRRANNRLLLIPAAGNSVFELVCRFTKNQRNDALQSYEQVLESSRKGWEKYWNTGGMVDFSKCTDSRACELERRVVLSQYLMATQCAGSLPPQETGLTYNSWYGKYHLEMHWWHGVHFALWGKSVLFEKSLWWYSSILPQARLIAKRQGYKGVRWPKMTSAEGFDSPSPIGPLLIWQQPHPIYYAELLYKINPCVEILKKYKDIVFESAKFMADYAQYDEEKDRYVLGPALIPAQENHNPEDVLNPPFELEYWAFGLRTANLWRQRMGIERESGWNAVADGLSELPVGEGLYLSHENCPDTYTKYNVDHPIMLGALGMLMGAKVDKDIMKITYEKVLACWKFDHVWGWDFPMMAMTAARLGKPDWAIDILFHDSPKNEYLNNGHNKQADAKALTIYLPGNGALLSAIAMMAAGWEGCDEENPGFPKDGRWNIKWEGLLPAL